MANTITVDVVSAEEQIFSGEAEFVVLPGVDGELGIYPRHTPLFTQIKPGAVRIKVPGQAQEELVFVQGGFLEVQPHKVTVLADTAIRAHDLDEVKALEAKKRAGCNAEQGIRRDNGRGPSRISVGWRSSRLSGSSATEPNSLIRHSIAEGGRNEPPFSLLAIKTATPPWVVECCTATTHFSPRNRHG